MDEQVADTNLYPGVLDCYHLTSFRKLLFLSDHMSGVPTAWALAQFLSQDDLPLPFPECAINGISAKLYIYRCLAHVTWFQEKNLPMLKFWVPSFHLECASSVYTGPRKRRNQFAYSQEMCLWKTDSAGGRRWAVCPSWS